MTADPLWQKTAEFVPQARELERLLEDGVIDYQSYADTLEAIRLPVELKAQNVAAYSHGLKARAGMIEGEILRLRHLKEMVERQAANLEEYLLVNMQRAGIQKIESTQAPFFRISVRKNPPKVVIDSEDELPWEFKREKTIIEADKALIKDALKQGLTVAGAHLEQTEMVEIK